MNEDIGSREQPDIQPQIPLMRLSGHIIHFNKYQIGFSRRGYPARKRNNEKQLLLLKSKPPSEDRHSRYAVTRYSKMKKETHIE